MPVNSYNSPNEGGKPTSGVGNAGGKPILPILFGVVCVIALILVTLALQKKPTVSVAPTASSGNRQIAQDSPPNAANTATGQTDESRRTTPPGPAVAPITPQTAQPGDNKTTPAEVGAGRNQVAPPGPAASSDYRTGGEAAQGMKR